MRKEDKTFFIFIYYCYYAPFPCFPFIRRLITHTNSSRRDLRGVSDLPLPVPPVDPILFSLFFSLSHFLPCQKGKAKLKTGDPDEDRGFSETPTLLLVSLLPSLRLASSVPLPTLSWYLCLDSTPLAFKGSGLRQWGRGRDYSLIVRSRILREGSDKD